MSALLFPELAKEMSGSNRQVAEALEAESLRLEELRKKPEEAEAIKRQAPRSARGATSAALTRRVSIVGLWQHVLELFEDGLSAGQARETLDAMRDSIDNWLRVVQDCRALWKLVADVGGSPEGLEGLDAAEAEVRGVRLAVERKSAFLNRPKPP